MNVTIKPYQPEDKEAFYRLNEEWISAHFQMEAPDHEVLGNPEQYILDRGGFILVATLEDQVVGVCALLKREEIDGYELAKMAVAPAAQGKSIGYLLGKAAIEKARSMQARRLFLDSNTRLHAAIKLYEKLGFKKAVGPPSPYARVDIQMELDLTALPQ